MDTVKSLKKFNDVSGAPLPRNFILELMLRNQDVGTQDGLMWLKAT